MQSCPWCGRSMDDGCSTCGFGLEEEREDDFDLKEWNDYTEPIDFGPEYTPRIDDGPYGRIV